ncbi:MAG: glycoside hydrolase family 88 protein [Bacteroidetes bacterium]|nr:glycoside hydrolase family 88 protein [Bacteroidota bacterium]
MNQRIVFLFALSVFCSKGLFAQETLSLSGEWSVRLDPQKTGEQQGWYKQRYEKKIVLPGTLDDAGIGAPPTLTDQRLGKDVMVHLTRKHSYIGYAWYAREVNIPESWKGKVVDLILERVLWTSRVWIDGVEAGTRESLSTPHRYDLHPGTGRHLIVICIDNSRKYDISHLDMAHAYTEGTQIIWNGIIGKMQLVARNRTYIRSVQVYPSEKDRTVAVTTSLSDDPGRREKGVLRLQVLDRNKKIVAQKVLTLAAGQTKLSTAIAVPSCKAWDEFNPELYTVNAVLDAGGRDRATAVLGMRDLGNSNSLLSINGRRLFLRGTLECNIFPLTGHPPMDRKGWLKVFSTAKAYGLNHLRFHSWCPPAAAFEVADSMGFYLQVELPFWNKNAGMDGVVDGFLEEEALRISREYGNHPSFCLWSMGNELDGDFDWLAGMVKRLRNEDPRHLYTSTTFTFQAGHGKWPEPGDDYYITQYTKKGWIRGQGIFNTIPPDFKSDYTKAVDGLPVPVLIHEMGQYSVYPRLEEIRKYTGVLDPLNFKAVRNDLDRKGLLALAPAFTKASGVFSAGLYKEEIERAMRTQGISGFELLDLHDFPGQGTALIGILDAFWDSKGLVTPEEHRMYCSPVVPLLRFDRASYTSDQRFDASAEVANFGAGVLRGCKPVWTVRDAAGRLVFSGSLASRDLSVGSGQRLGEISFDLRGIRAAEMLTIELSLMGTPYKNRWKIWVYPSSAAGVVSSDVVFDTVLDQALVHLKEGKKVLLNPDTASINGVAGRFAPVFWSPVHFPNQPGTMGILCDPKHPALKDFPTEFHSDWQWWDMITASKTMILDSLPAMNPIVRVIDNFFKNRKMADVIEARVGRGRLLLASVDITHDLDRRPAARQLRYSLEKYMQGEAFMPGVELTPTQLGQLVGASPAALHDQVDKYLKEAAGKVRLLVQHTSADSFPETFDPRAGKWAMGKSSSWMSGFYPGELLRLFEYTHDSALYREAVKKLSQLKKEQYNKDTHDLGFMIYCPFGEANHLAPSSGYRDVLLNSAKSLASRFSPAVGCTRSWNSAPSQFMVIIDNMMNLELLCEATKLSGDSSFYRIAVTHANTTMKNHFRPDHSSYHLVIYDPQTGAIEKRQTVQGAADESAWARGQAWGLYGYTMMYRETGDRRYLQQAEDIAGFILPRLPEDKIPYWDFNAPGIPNASRDVSAGAVMCSALLELSEYVEPRKAHEYKSSAEAMLRSLLSPAYSSAGGEDGGYLLKHGVGNFPKNSDIDVSIIYADYYLIEAMLRYQHPPQADTILSRYRRAISGVNAMRSQEVARLVSGYDSVKQWPDIVYGDTARGFWSPLAHLDRIRTLALEWSDPGSGHFHDKAVWRVINGALDNWLEKRYHNSNWWHNEIGVPQLMRDILVVLHDTLSSARLNGALQVLGQYRLQQPGNGANLVWSADLGLHYGALTGNDSLIRVCADRLAGEVHIATGDGIQSDYSFHQHLARLQMYQYGAAYLEQNARLAWELKGTTWAYPEDRIRLLTSFVLEGWQWMCRGVNTVPGTIDRSVSRIGALHSADLRGTIPYLCELDPSRADELRALAARQNGVGQPLEGFRYFPRSDFSVYQDRRFGFFLKTMSDRTLPSESINSENLKGRWLNAGDAYTIGNGEEYFNLMPVWDWEHLPGVTGCAAADGGGKLVRHAFTGSVSDGKGGVTVMDYQLGEVLKARKFWACHDGVVVCLLGDLRSDAAAYTTIDQCRWRGDIVADGRVVGEGSDTLNAARWIQHDGKACIFVRPSKVVVRAGSSGGSWQSINASEPATPVTEQVYMPVMMHSPGTDSCGYVLTACATPGQARRLARRPSWTVVRNGGDCQAVRFGDGAAVCAFYAGGSLVLDRHRTVTVDRPCLLMVEKDALYVSDPAQKGMTVTINLSGKTYTVEVPADGTTVISRYL